MKKRILQMYNKKPNLIISTCGISLASNIKNCNNKKYKENFNIFKYTNNRFSPDNKDLDTVLSDVDSTLKKSDLETQRKLSAELNGLWAFYENQPEKYTNDLHYLIHTDTWLGGKVAENLQMVMEKQKLNIQLQKIEDLRTSSLGDFRNGIGNLISFLENLLENYQNSYKIIFNLSGGFKSIQGVMQTLASIYADEVIYIFEGSKTLLTIPRLPMKLDEGVVKTYLRELRRLSLNLPLKPEEINRLPQVFLYRIENQIDLSEWGRLIFERSKNELYPEKLWDSPSEQIQYGENFSKSLQGLDGSRLKHINERIDDLVRYIEHGNHHNINRLDFKQLKGNPIEGSTHECDAWADRDTKRIFCHYENRKIVLDFLGDALH